MSVFYHSSYVCPTADSARPTHCLWSDDPYLSSRLLAAIASEAVNRGLPVCGEYHPMMPSLLVGLEVNGIGNFTASPSTLPKGAKLIDCTVLASKDTLPSDELQPIARQKQALTESIGQIGACLQAQTELCKSLSAPMVRTEELTQKAMRIAQKIKGGCNSQRTVPICGNHGTDEVYRLPFGEEVKIIGIEGQYHLPELFLDALLAALSERTCEYVILENALTQRQMGVWLPTEGRCYLLRAPEDLCQSQLSLGRYLTPYTQSHRHNQRILQSAYKAWQDRLAMTVSEYQFLCEKEEALYAPLYKNDRLQSFRKRLLIDLFC